MKIAFISSVVPQPTIAGSVVLWRHFERLRLAHSDVRLRVFTNVVATESQPWDLISLRRNAIVERLTRTRVSKLAHAWTQYGWSTDYSRLRVAVDDFDPDVVLTVAHGELFHAAAKIARQMGLPLATIYHDWWPDMTPVSLRCRNWVEHEFRRVAAQSDVNFCVSRGMMERLNVSNSKLLYPIPGKRKKSQFEVARASQQEKPKIGYCGNLGQEYGRMILELCVLLESADEIEFRFSGGSRDWGEIDIARAGARDLGMLDVAHYERFMLSSDVLLVIMSFREADKIRSSTSFPSKILEYCQAGRPILVWGPSYSSAVQWARETGGGAIVESRDPVMVLRKMREIVNDPCQGQQMAEASRRAATEEFDPDRIHRGFEDALFSLVNQTSIVPI